MFVDRIRRYLIPAVVFTFAVAVPATAQVSPIPRQPDWERDRQAYTAQALQSFNQMLTQWRDAVNQDDVRAAVRMYTDHATLHILDGAPATGRTEIDTTLREALPRISELRTGVQDFAASERFAYAVGRYWYQLTAEDAPSESVSGTYVLVAERQGRQWRIRTQLFKNDSAD